MRLQRQTNKKPQVIHQNSVECSCVLRIGAIKTLFEIFYLLLSGQSKFALLNTKPQDPDLKLST